MEDWEKKLSEAFEGQRALWEQYKKTIHDEVKLTSSELKERLAKMEQDFADYEQKIAAATKASDALAGQMKDVEAKLNRPSSRGAANGFERKDFVLEHLYRACCDAKFEERKEATWRAIRGQDLTPEQKALTIGDPETGGYLAPPDFVNEIIKEMRETTPAMSLARVRTTSNVQIHVPKKTGTISAVRRGESETKSETTGLKYGLEVITLPELYAYLDASEQDLEDSAFNLEAEISEEITDAFNAKVGAEFVSGSGPLQIEGILTNSSVGSVASGDASHIKASSLITLVEGTLKPQYNVNGRLLFNLSTLAEIRSLTNAVSGDFIWQPGFGALPNTILGKPYTVCPDMPSVAGSAFPIVYGDFNKACLIGLRVNIGIKKITDSTLDAAGAVRFSARMRIGGKVVNANAIAKYKISAT